MSRLICISQTVVKINNMYSSQYNHQKELHDDTEFCPGLSESSIGSKPMQGKTVKMACASFEDSNWLTALAGCKFKK